MVGGATSRDIGQFGYRVIQLEVTNRCNMACSFCPLPIRQAPLKDVSQREALDILDRLASLEGIDFVAFHQFGEPLMYSGIWDCIDRCRELGLRSQIVTNGLLLKDPIIDRLLAHPPNILRISAQTLNPVYHAATRGVEVDFETYIERVARCVAALLDRDHGIEEIRTDLAVNEDRYYGLAGGVHRVARVIGVAEAGDPTLFNETPRTLRPHLIALLHRIERHARRFRALIPHLDECIARYYSAEGFEAGWATAYQFASNHAITYKRFINGRRISSYHPVERSLCGTDIIGILADGTVTCCCLDYEGFTGLGNIFADDLVAILDRNRSILDGLHSTGRLHFDACKRCLGAPTRLGAALKNVVNRFRYQ